MNAPANTHPFNPVIIVPGHDTAGGLPALLDRLALIGLPLIVIADNPTDVTSEALRRYGNLPAAGLPLSPSPGTPGEGRGGGSLVARTHTTPPEAWYRDNRPSALVIHSQGRHRGRAHALRAGFAAAIKAGHTHALTLSIDAEDAPDQIQKLVAAAREHRHSLVLAGANKSHSRGLTSVLLSLEAGVHIRDARRGLRVYPLSLVALTPCRSNGTAYEIEILARAGWSRCPIIEVPINSNEETRDTSGGLFVPSPGTPGEGKGGGYSDELPCSKTGPHPNPPP
ncbi:MAG: glycosyltransferase, partial [Phycisphaerales bacterium]|nr:glycosyltransferase [Phycisphaerales bacterium]